MAPREATGTFPDQFLTFDYEAAVPLGIQPPHEQMPQLQEGENEDLGVPLGQDALNHVGTSTQSATDGTRHGGSNFIPIDPLSIDPTIDDSQSDDEYFRRSQSGDVPPPPPISARLPFSSISSVESMEGDGGLDDNSTSPLSTGSSLLLTSTAPNSPTSPVSDDSDPILRARRRLFEVQSVLDADSTLADEPSLPGLERTFDSAMTSLNVVSEEFGTTHAMDVDENPENSRPPSAQASPSNVSESGSEDSSESIRMIYRNSAFDSEEPASPFASSLIDSDDRPSPPVSPNSIMLSFGPNTTVADLKYFAERGCIVPLLQALTTPRLVTLGTRMLADYAKMSHRRVAVASNKRILEFVQRTMLLESDHADWLGREYAVETIRSLTATEASDQYLMASTGLLSSLALVARGGPFSAEIREDGTRRTVPMASDKARLHACIAIMNLSCGKANKIEIAKIPEVLESMRDVMLNSNDESRLKATTCVKNLSNADANDEALLGTPRLVEALAHVATVTCSPETGATPSTTNACLALMNLSISKANKHRVFRTPGVMESLMTVLERTTAHGASTEARVKACSALSNLAIGYDNKIPMFNYPGFVESILDVIQTDVGEARTKTCSILWSFAAEMKNQVPIVQRRDILPVLVQVAEEDGVTEARFKCVAALTLLAESLDNAVPLLEAGALTPLMEILHDAGADPTQWKGQTASWCVGFFMNIAQSDEAVPALREAGVVELLAPLLTLDHYQSLKAAMAVTFCCRFDEGDECYDLLRKTENVIPKIISLLHNTLAGRGGNGYKYGVFTLRSSVGCIAALASGPEYMKERVATGPVFESLLRVISDFCVDGGTPGAIVGGGKDDGLSATLAIRALQSLTGHLIPIAGSSGLPFGTAMEDHLINALESFEYTENPGISQTTRDLAIDAKIRIQGWRNSSSGRIRYYQDSDFDVDMPSLSSSCCGFGEFSLAEGFMHALSIPTLSDRSSPIGTVCVSMSNSMTDKNVTVDESPIRTFLLSDSRTGRRFVVPSDPSGGRSFNDARVWCFRRGRFCVDGERPDPSYVWTPELQEQYEATVSENQQTPEEHSS